MNQNNGEKDNINNEDSIIFEQENDDVYTNELTDLEDD